MIRSKTGGMLSLMVKPLYVAIILLSLFGLIRLRSAVVAVNYDIRTLEEKKAESLKNMKLLLAERSKYASLEKLAASFKDATPEGKVRAEGGNFFGNRVRVIHMKKSSGPQPYRAALGHREGKQPE